MEKRRRTIRDAILLEAINAIRCFIARGDNREILFEREKKSGFTDGNDFQAGYSH